MVVVLDCSASMATQTGANMGQASASSARIADTTVFQKAIACLDSMLYQSKNEHIVLYTYPSCQAYQGTPEEIRTILGTLKPCFVEGDLENFFQNIQQIIDGPGFFISDGSEKWDPPPNIFPIYCGVKNTNNVGWTDFQVAPLENQAYGIFAVLQNFSSSPASIHWILQGSTDAEHWEKIEAKNLEIPAHQQYFLNKKLDSAFSFLTLQITPDNFSLDDQVWAVKVPDISVDLSTACPALKKVCGAIPHIQDTQEKKQKQVYFIPCSSLNPICDGWIAYQKPFFPTQLKIEPKQKKNPQWSFTPLLEAVHPELIEIPDFVSVLCPPFPSDTEIIFCEQENPVISYGKNWLFLGISLEKSDWVHWPSFPIFWQNFFDHLDRERGNFVYQKPRHSFIGLYKDNDNFVAFNLLSPRESNNQGQELNNQEMKSLHFPSFQKQQNIAPFFIFLAIVLLSLLWALPKNRLQHL
jgi:hypothetical protein